MQWLVGCFLHFHKMIPTPRCSMYPVMHRLLFASPAQSTSQIFFKIIPLPRRHNVKSKCPSNISWCVLRPSNAVDKLSTWIGSLNSLQMQYWPSLTPLHTWEILPQHCMEYLLFSFAHSQIPHLKVLNFLNSHRTKFQLVYILICWNTWRPPQHSSFGSWWWYGLFYSS